MAKQSGYRSDDRQDLSSQSDLGRLLQTPTNQLLLLENIHDAIIGLDQDFSITYWSPSAEKLYGWKGSEVQGKRIHQFFQVEPLQARGAEIKSALEEKGCFRFETTQRHKDGHTLYAEASLLELSDARGQFLGFICTIRDITGRQEVEQERKAILASLREEKDQAVQQAAELRAVIEAFNDPVVFYDQKGIACRVNEAAKRAFGFDLTNQNRETMLQRLNLRNMDGKPFLIADLPSSAAIRGDTVLNKKFQYTNAEGQNIIVEGSAYPVLVDGQQTGTVTIWRDVTRREQGEAVLRENERTLRERETRFSQLADSMPQLVWTARSDGSVDYYNQRYQEYKGIAPGEGESWQWGPVLHPDDLQATAEAWQRAVETGEIYQIQHRVQVADGSYRWHLSRAVPAYDTDRRIIKWYGTATDIHDAKMTEQALMEQSEGLEFLFNAAGEFLRSDDPFTMLDSVYQRLTRLLGLDIYVHYSVAPDGKSLDLVSLTGFSPQIRKHLQHLDLDNSVCGAAAQTHQVIVVNDVQHSSDPRVHLVRTQGITAYACHPLVVQERLLGTLSFGTRSRTHFDQAALGIMRVVSDLVATAIYRKQSEVEVQEYAEKLQRSNQELEQFAFVASHDLQEPLRKVRTFGDMLRKTLEGQISSDASDMLARMQSATERMQAMISALLDLSRVNMHGNPFQPIDLTEIAAEVVNDLEVRIHRTGGEVRVSPLPTIEADPFQMRQLLQNLIGNALKFHKPGTPPLVTVSAGSVPRSGAGKSTMVAIQVEDNGIGFDPQHFERILQPFQRLQGRSQYEGTGIGLSICNRIIERHHGKFIAHSTPGEGSRFTIFLPIRQSS